MTDKIPITPVNWSEMAGDSCKLRKSWGVYITLPEEDELIDLIKMRIFGLYENTPSTFQYSGKTVYPNLAQEIMAGICVAQLLLLPEEHARAIMDIFNEHPLYKSGYCALFDKTGQCLDENC